VDWFIKSFLQERSRLLENVFQNPFKEITGLTSLTVGVAATDEIRSNLLEAKEKGKVACKEFVEGRCSSKPKLDFFDPLKKLKLKTFKDLKAI
jgi:hypothetical protein